MDSTGRRGDDLLTLQRDARATDGRKQRLPQTAHQSWRLAEQFLVLSDEELSRVDPVVMNLIVAQGIPALVNIDIGRYVRLADKWAADLRAHMAAKEREFYRTPSTGTTILIFSA